MTKLAIIGAGGHARVVADASFQAGWTEICFFDDRWAETRDVGPWKVAGTIADFEGDPGAFDGAIVAIGDNRARLARHRGLVAAGVEIATIVHPRAVVSRFAKIGRGSTLLANSVVNCFVQLGEAVIVNTAATVDHDCVLADGVHISPGAHLGGSVMVGEAAWIGIGAAVRHAIMVGHDSIVGAGAVVIGDVGNGTTVGGVPAKTLRRSKPR